MDGLATPFPPIYDEISLHNLIKSACPFIPFSLIGKGFQERIERFGSLWGANFQSHLFGFECSLREGDEWGDFHISLSSFLGNKSELRGVINIEDSSWDRTIALLDEWNQSGYMVENDVIDVVLGLDIGSNSDWPPRPNIFFSFKPMGKDPSEFLERAFLHFYHKPAAMLLSSLRPYIETKSLSTIGFLLARPGYVRAAVNSNFSDIDALKKGFSQPSTYGIFDSLSKMIKGNTSFPIYPLRFGITLNERGIISPKIGVAMNRVRSVTQESFAPLLKQLEENGLVSEVKRNALLSWAGRGSEPYYDLPSEFSRILVRKINHLKFVCSPNEPLWVKAYISVSCFAANEGGHNV